MLQLRKKRFKKIGIIFAALIIVLALGFSGFKIVSSATLNKPEILTENLTCTDADQISGFIRGLNINYFYFKKEVLEARVKEKFFCIGKTDVSISYPNSLKLKVWGRETAFVVSTINTNLETNPVIELPQATSSASESTKEAVPSKVIEEVLKSLKTASSSAGFLVDEEGVVFNETSEPVDYPKLSLFGSDLKVGGKIGDDLIKKAKIVVAKLEEIDAPSDNLIVIGDRLIVDSKPRVTFSLKSSLDHQSASLQLILAQAKMNQVGLSADNKSIESIDLRFDKPVIVYGKK